MTADSSPAPWPPAPRPPAPWTEDTGAAWLHPRLGDPARQRRDMVAALHTRLAPLVPQLGAPAIAAALAAMAQVPREAFVCPLAADLAYLPAPIDIGLGQIISHPTLVAIIAAAIAPGGAPPDTATADPALAAGPLLDVGTGSGYQAAVLAQMAGHVTSVEIIAAHAALARRRLARLGIGNVSVHAGDGSAQGRFAPGSFAGIVAAAGAADPPPALLNALRIGGRLVMPLGASHDDEWLVQITRIGTARWRSLPLVPARFVPLTGAGARPPPAAANPPDG